MAEKKNPTNADIYKEIGGLQATAKAIHNQVKATNGRVTALEKWKESLDIIEAYKLKNPLVPRMDGWTTREKTLTAIITSLLALLATLIGTGKL